MTKIVTQSFTIGGIIDHFGYRHATTTYIEYTICTAFTWSQFAQYWYLDMEKKLKTTQLDIEDIKQMFEEMHIVPQKKNPLEVLQEIEDFLRKEPEQYVIFIVSTTKPYYEK